MGIDPVGNNYGNYYSEMNKPTPDQFDLNPPADCDPHNVYRYCTISLLYIQEHPLANQQDFDTDINKILSFEKTALGMQNQYLTPQDQESLRSMIKQVQDILKKYP